MGSDSVYHVVNICTDYESKHVSSYFVSALICTDFVFSLEHSQ